MFKSAVVVNVCSSDPMDRQVIGGKGAGRYAHPLADVCTVQTKERGLL